MPMGLQRREIHWRVSTGEAGASLGTCVRNIDGARKKGTAHSENSRPFKKNGVQEQAHYDVEGKQESLVNQTALHRMVRRGV